MNMVELIAKRRENQTHTFEELEFIANGAAQDSIPDYQLAAWLMAAFLNPLNLQETAWLTKAMAESGERIDLSGLPHPWLDKHSTGGVGDKTTLVFLPIMAACGLTVVKMSGRGLGITGGTVDKLGAIPGFRLDLSPEEMKAQANKIGLAITGQTPRLAPADGRLYALRDVTATVPSIPLIVSSILSKKVAGGADHVVFDVKCGAGAFMKTPADAQVLASQLEQVGCELGLKVRARITDMDEPLGRCAGNALEVKEAMAVLRGEERGRFRDLCFGLAASALELTGIPNAEQKVMDVLDSGAALEKTRQWMEAQGGDPSVCDSDDWGHAPVTETVEWSGEPGWVSDLDAEAVGLAVIDLGGGRKKKSDEINPAVGVECIAKVGDQVETGQTIFRIHAANQSDAEQAKQRLATAITSQSNQPEPKPIFFN
ncbi:MAG: thymidine phosphorylase [Armatimonadetes bacterium]|nr:thymidine phosphorylase [Armatimonadota bacterium]